MYKNPTKLSHEEKDEMIHKMAEALKACADLPVFWALRHPELYEHIQELISQAKGVSSA